MSSSLAKMFTKRRTWPLSSQIRSLMPGYCVSRLAMSAPTVAPLAVTSSFPCVSLRSGVGMRMVAMAGSPLSPLLFSIPQLVEVGQPRPDQLRLGQLSDQRVLRLHAVAGDADDDRSIVLADVPALDQTQRRAQRDAARGLGEDALGLGEQAHRREDLHVVGLGGPAARADDGLARVVAVGRVADGERLRDAGRGLDRLHMLAVVRPIVDCGG